MRDSLLITVKDGKSILRCTIGSPADPETLATLPGELTGLCVARDGTLFVTGGGPDGRVWHLNEQGEILETIQVGHTPMSPVLSPDGATLYICNRFDNDVSMISVKSGETLARFPAIREPVAIDITPDGRTLFVANLLPHGPADVDYVACAVNAIDTQTREVSEIKLVNGSEGMRGLRVSPDGKYVFATHLMARFMVPTTQLERGWINTDALSVIDATTRKLLYTVLLDDVEQGFPNPWAIDFSEDGKTLIVSSAGNHEISLIHLEAMVEKIDQEKRDEGRAVHLDAHNDLSFLSDIRRRVSLHGNGPRAIAVKGDTAYVANYYSDSIDPVDMNSGQVGEAMELNPDLAISQVRQGEIFFNDATLCFQNWLSCASCHPDARTDGLNWDLLNDGIGNPKNAKSMLLAHETPRAMWLGVRADAETAVRAGLKHIQFAVRPEEDAQAIDAYLRSLQPVPSPYLENGELSASAKRGEQIFKEIRCVKCHPAPLFTDLEEHDVKTTKGQDVGRPVNTPSLVESWRRAPYFHDGRAATHRDVIESYPHARMLEKTANLSKEQLDDLIEYLMSL